MAYSASSRQNERWQTVKSLKEQKKAKSKEEVRKAPKREGLVAADPATSVFAALDAWQRPAAQGETDLDSISSASSTDAGHATNGHANGHTPSSTASKAAKQKTPKVKKLKVTLQQAAHGVASDTLQEFLDRVTTRYASDESYQLESLVDYFLTVFREVDLPFNKMLAEQPLAKAAETPLSALSPSVQQLVSGFFRQRSLASLEAFALQLLHAAFQGVPESSASKASPAKAKVGLLVVLALLLRTRPEVLAAISRQAAASGCYVSSGRLPQLLWVLSQVQRRSRAGALAAASTIIIPQVLGIALPPPTKQAPAATEQVPAAAVSPATAAVALDYMDSLLQGGAGLQALAEHGIACGEEGGEPVQPLVSPVLLAALQRGTHGAAAAGVAPEAAARVRRAADLLQGVAFAGSGAGGFDCCEMLRQSLESAALAEGPPAGAADDLIAEAAVTVVQCLAVDDEAFAAWQQWHKHHLRGSTRVLQQLLATSPASLQPLAAKRGQWQALLLGLRQRHKFQLASAKGWQGACAAASEDACLQLAAGGGGAYGRSADVSGAGALSGAVRTACITALVGCALAVAVTRNQALQQHARLRLGNELVDRIATRVNASTASAGEACSQALATVKAMLQPHVEQAALQVAPYAQRASKAVTPALRQLSEQVQPYAQALATRIYSISQRVAQHGS